MLSTCLPSDVFQIEGCLAGLDVGAMVCMLTEGDAWMLKGRTGCARFASSKDVEDEQHFLFSYPAYRDVRLTYASLLQQAFSVSDFFTNSDPNACGFLRKCFSRKKNYCIHLTYH